MNVIEVSGLSKSYGLNFTLNNINFNLESGKIFAILGLNGAGKTTFVRAFLEEKEVQSPTYSLVLEYDNILHADLYRLEKKEDLIHLELPMYIEDKDYFLVEWGTKYESNLIRMVGDEWKAYQLKIEINQITSNGLQSRNYFLNKI